ncbi:MAG: deoxynucleoside kinase [Rikenella sp.]|nr:deoxynucleoside kinase [Rikenella sp.]
MYIAIAGNIGSGKSYLTELLSRQLGWDAQYEESENPYIGDFYDDMKRWAFNLQVYFLGKRQRQIDGIFARSEEGSRPLRPVVVDRTIYEDAQVFATHLHHVGLLSSRDYTTYMQLYDFTVANLPRPVLLVYLRASVPTLVSQIQRRGRIYEASIDAAYLEGLNRLYEAWIDTYDGPKWIVDVDREDFVTDPAVRETILTRIEEHLHGLVESE